MDKFHGLAHSKIGEPGSPLVFQNFLELGEGSDFVILYFSHLLIEFLQNILSVRRVEAFMDVACIKVAFKGIRNHLRFLNFH